MAKKKDPSIALPELPEQIQQKIVLSLPPMAFARSSILSKPWLSFYNSTRYSFNLNFDYNFNCQLDTDRVRQELQREIMNFDEHLSSSLLREKLTVDEFNINLKLYRYLNIPQHYSDKLTDLVYKWLDVLFTRNNIVKILQIKIQKSSPNANFYFPQEIFSKIFSNESLQVLHLESNCILDGVHPRNLGFLRVLILYSVFIDGKSTYRLLTACPILEQLTWKNNGGGQHIIIKGLHRLKDLNIWGLVDVRIQEAPALENVSAILEGDERTIINAQACRRIQLLTISANSETTGRHIQQIVSCLPALENLTLTILCPTDITISSLCLKNLELCIFEDPSLIMVKIIAPNLRSYVSDSLIPQLMMKTGMLERVVIELEKVEIDGRLDVQELRKALLMIEDLKLGVDTIELYDQRTFVHVKASRLDEKLNVSATRVIEMLDAGAVKLVDGKFCF